MDRVARKIHIRGLVQGVGFRPFIYRLANEHNISGWVVNQTDGVTVAAEGWATDMERFMDDISGRVPEAASIAEVVTEEKAIEGSRGFRIRKSDDLPGAVTEISPDIAVCKSCLDDMKHQEHRVDFPFINCTNCGPRFTIIRDLPYDREMTTMRPFEMCSICEKEYTDVSDRRFHAQPVACNNCGPQYSLWLDGREFKGIQEVLKMTSQLIKNGKIVAIKGMGGYHLACNALSEEAVCRLRKRKLRDGKPFAVMFRDVDAAMGFTEVSDAERKALTSWRRPIVILRNKPEGRKLAAGISVGFETTGAMLPYMPFHYLLFEKLETPVIVLTSGNISDEPVIISDEEARQRLSGIANAILWYNRDIHNRADDSVEMYIAGMPQLIRRSRGYVPSPVRLSLLTEGIVAAGAELVNCFCVGKGNDAILSQHIGDLKNLETLEFYSEALSRFKRMFRVTPELLVHDLHPDYLSTRYAAGESATKNIPVVAVQHHHAHIASCMAEHRLDEPVIGISFDGVGLGDDGKIWGGEFFLASLEKFERKYHFEYVPMPGGDLVTEHPWRMAVSYLMRTYGEEYRSLDLAFLDGIKSEHRDLVEASIKKGINAPMTSSAGRLFDAVSAMIGLCTDTSFHAEAPMRLESIARKDVTDSYPYETVGRQISFAPLFRNIHQDMEREEDKGRISSKFHHTLVNVIADIAGRIRSETGICKAVLSGGSFQNRIISYHSVIKLREAGFDVYTQQKVPANDGGIALGQLAIAAKWRSLGLIG